MKRPALLAIGVGLVLAVTLLATNDLSRIFVALRDAGWAIVLVIALHLPQTLFSALGWRALIDGPQRRLWLVYRLRWVRESVNALLPVAQIGGDVVRVRLTMRRGTPLVEGVSASVVDVSVEMIAQILFTLIGVALLIAGPHSDHALLLALIATGASALIAGAFMASQRFGLFRLIERGVARFAQGEGRALGGDLSGLNDAVLHLYGNARRVWPSGLYHLLSWLLGVLETYAALKILGLQPTLREATIIEGLGQAVRAFGFLVPGALGIQEGGYLLICAMFGISPQKALALSLIRRIRELVLGLPGLALWHHMEGGRAAAPAAGDPIA